jgi:hypothetical protein
MKCCATILKLALSMILLSWTAGKNYWLKKELEFFNINYTIQDESSIDEYGELILVGLKKVEKFFDGRYKNKFEVFIYPNRNSLDSAWRDDWKTPGFKSECWMVASGISEKIDILSPMVWDAESCEHKYSQKEQTQKLITHELVHIFHGQLNISPDFNDVTNIDWFIEGLATYASGQCDSSRIGEVKKAINDGTVPGTIDQFWTGKLKYALSGTMVMYIDKRYGRTKVKELLQYNRKQKILQALGITEINLLSKWKEYTLSVNTRIP